MDTCAYCHANALYHDRTSGTHLCLAHARLEVAGPRAGTRKPPLAIRSAISADRARIAELADHFWGEVEVECLGRSYRVDALPAAVACDGNEIVGFASYAREEDAVDLVMLNVLPRWQGRGAARALIAAVTEVARTDGAARIIVATSNDDLPALGLYQRLGFTITEVCVGELLEHHGGVESGFAGIPVRDEVRMELRV